jgi:hypothetical protein
VQQLIIMPIVEVQCPYCGARASRGVGQFDDRGDLRWWESFSCDACGTHTEADGRDDMPSDWRAAILAEEGTFSLVAEGVPSVALLKAAKEALRLPMDALPELKARLPGVLARGTQCEMQVLANRMRRSAGAEVDVSVVLD